MNLVRAKFHLLIISVGEVPLKDSDKSSDFLIDVCGRKGRISPSFRFIDRSETKLVIKCNESWNSPKPENILPFSFSYLSLWQILYFLAWHGWHSSVFL